MPQGKIDITLKKATLTRDTELFGSMSPYVVVKIGTVHEFKSKVQHGSGKNPDFKSEFCFFELRESDTTEITFEFYDKENFQDQDDYICEGVFDFSDMIVSGKLCKETWVPLTYQKQGAGKILVKIEFRPSENPIPQEQAQNMWQQMPQMMQQQMPQQMI